MSVCATCLKPGLPADGRHDCPGLGDIQLTRQLGHGLRVDTAPARTRMALTVLADHGHGLAMQDADHINIADQVLYQVVGYDAESAALVLELVEDWRSKPNGSATAGGTCTATIRTPDNRVIHCTRPAGHYVEPEDWHRSTPDREGDHATWSDLASGATPHQIEPTPADATVCTPIPDATLRQMSEAPPELLTEQQRTRADNAEARLRLAREALIADGYFCRDDEIGDDIAPRITELSNARIETTRKVIKERDAAEQRAAKAETDLAWQQSVNSDLRVESRARGEKLAEGEDQLRRTRIELEHWQTVIVPGLRAERDKARTVLREVLAVFATVTSPTSGVPMGYQAPPIHPADMDRWRAALNSPKELTP